MTETTNRKQVKIAGDESCHINCEEYGQDSDTDDTDTEGEFDSVQLDLSLRDVLAKVCFCQECPDVSLKFHSLLASDLVPPVFSCEAPSPTYVPYDSNGAVVFDLDPEKIGLTYDDVFHNQQKILSPFFADVVGELIVREWISKFSDILMGIDPSLYNQLVNNREHKRFGLSFSQGVFRFSFHLSLVQRILTEDFKKISV